LKIYALSKTLIVLQIHITVYTPNWGCFGVFCSNALTYKELISVKNKLDSGEFFLADGLGGGRCGHPQKGVFATVLKI
jgi:hypothetical protein